MFVIICLILSVFMAIGFYIYLKPNQNRKNNSNSKKNKGKNGNDKGVNVDKLKQLFNIASFNKGIINTNDNRYIKIYSISSQDFEILTDDEQDVFENSLMNFSLSLSFPVQFYATAAKVETENATKLITELIESNDETIAEELKEYATKLRNDMKDMGNNREEFVRKGYCAISVSGELSDKKRALNELKNRENTVISGLVNARMKVMPLDTVSILQLLHEELNKGSNIKISQLIKDGALELYSQGIGSVIYAEDESEKEKAS